MIKFTQQMFDECDEAFTPPKEGELMDYSEARYDAVIHVLHAHGMSDLELEVPDAYNCPKSFTKWWGKLCANGWV